IATDLVSQAFNSGSEQNISAIVVDILDVLPMIPPIDRADAASPEHAKNLYGPKMALELAPVAAQEEESRTQKPEKKKGTKFAVLPPIRLRTVMPDSDIESI